MHLQCCSFTIFLALTSLQITRSTAKYLAEKPAYLSTCDFNDANLNSCVANTIKVTFSEWKTGVPGLKSLGPLEPLTIKRIRIQQNNGEAFNLIADLENLVIHGVSQATIKNVIIDKKSLAIDFTIEIPKLHADGNYKAKGSLLGFKIDGQGPGAIDATNVRLQFHVNAKLRNEAGFTFIDITSLKAKIAQISDFNINAQNLFGGLRELENTANDVFKQNRFELMGIVQPALEQAIEALFKDRFTKIFAYIPANYFFTNLPKVS